MVNRVQRLVHPAKVGHAGTLDPLATGVLVVCLGQATKLIPYVQRMPKQYKACFLLGKRSASHDLETPLETQTNAARPSASQIESVLPRLVGRIKQTPPAYSAVKVRGQRAYKLARQDEQVGIAPRTVRVDSLCILSYQYPRLELRIRCGGGTYIRSLGVDLAAMLDTSAVMSALLREAVGDYRIGDATGVENLGSPMIRSEILSPLTAVADLRRARLCDAEVQDIRHGRVIMHRPESSPPTPLWCAQARRRISSDAAAAPDPPGGPADEIAGVDADGNLVALLREKQPGALAPVRVFAQSE